MKISQEIMAKTERQPVRQTREGNQGFEQMVQTEGTRVRRQELERLVDDITKQGEKLARFRSFQDLAKFKRMIKQFLQETVQKGMRVKEERSFHSNSFNQTFTTVEEIDEKLVALTEDVMDQEKKTVDLLGVIGEIRGLLVNLYT